MLIFQMGFNSAPVTETFFLNLGLQVDQRPSQGKTGERYLTIDQKCQRI